MQWDLPDRLTAEVEFMELADAEGSVAHFPFQWQNLAIVHQMQGDNKSRLRPVIVSWNTPFDAGAKLPEMGRRCTSIELPGCSNGETQHLNVGRRDLVKTPVFGNVEFLWAMRANHCLYHFFGTSLISNINGHCLPVTKRRSCCAS